MSKTSSVCQLQIPTYPNVITKTIGISLDAQVMQLQKVYPLAFNAAHYLIFCSDLVSVQQNSPNITYVNNFFLQNISFIIQTAF